MSLASIRKATVRLAQVSALAISLAGATAFGGALPVLYAWNPEIAQILPATSTFTRASTSQVLTTTDGTTFWYQETKSGELRLDGMRRQENLLSRDLTWTLPDGTTEADLGEGITRFGNIQNQVGDRAIKQVTIDNQGGIRFAAYVEARGVEGEKISIGIKRSGGTYVAAQLDITLTTDFTKYYIGEYTAFSDNTSVSYIIVNSGFADADEIDIRNEGFCIVTGAPANSVPEFVNDKITYNAEVVGVHYFNTTAANTSSPATGGVVTEATGTTITGGGYLPEPAATNISIESSDQTRYTVGQVTFGTQQVAASGLSSFNVNANTPGSTPLWFPTDVFAQTSGTTYTLTSIIEDVDASRVLVRVPLDTAGTFRGWVNFDLVGNTINAQSASIVNATIKAGAGGASICTVSWTPTASFSAQPLYQFTDLTTVPAETVSTAPAYSPSDENLVHHHTQVEATPYSTSPIITSGSTVTRVVDLLNSGVTPSVDWSLWADATNPTTFSSAPTLGGGNGSVRFIRMNGTTMQGINVASAAFGQNDIGDVTGTRTKFILTYEKDVGGFCGITGDVAAGTGIYSEDLSSIPFYVGIRSIGLNSWIARIHNIILYGTAASQAQAEALVA